jgi:cytochrome c556
MEVGCRMNTRMAVVGGIAFGAFALWFVQFALQKVQEHDARPRQANVKNQLMRRKATAMEDALNAIIRGNLAQVNAAAVRMKRSAITIDGYLATEAYEKFGEDFHQSIEELLAATAANDREVSKQAILRLENSCIECHYLINQPK